LREQPPAFLEWVWSQHHAENKKRLFEFSARPTESRFSFDDFVFLPIVLDYAIIDFRSTSQAHSNQFEKPVFANSFTIHDNHVGTLVVVVVQEVSGFLIARFDSGTRKRIRAIRPSAWTALGKWRCAKQRAQVR
jgi:hypothetical protein